jgi:hypothetical protein
LGFALGSEFLRSNEVSGVSPAAGQKNGRSNRKKNFGLAHPICLAY